MFNISKWCFRNLALHVCRLHADDNSKQNSSSNAAGIDYDINHKLNVSDEWSKHSS